MIRVNRFLENLNDLVKKHTPLKKLTKKDIKLRNKPWINNRIQKMMHLRDRLSKRLQRKFDFATQNLYKKFRNRVVVKLTHSKTNYFNNFFQTNNNNMKLLWSGIKTIISNKNSNVNVINKLKDASGNITSESNVIANTFNDFFVSVGKNVTQKIPRTMKSPMDYLRYNNEHSFFITPTIPTEVTGIISMLKMANLLVQIVFLQNC